MPFINDENVRADARKFANESRIFFEEMRKAQGLFGNDAGPETGQSGNGGRQDAAPGINAKLIVGIAAGIYREMKEKGIFEKLGTILSQAARRINEQKVNHNIFAWKAYTAAGMPPEMITAILAGQKPDFEKLIKENLAKMRECARK